MAMQTGVEREDENEWEAWKREFADKFRREDDRAYEELKREGRLPLGLSPREYCRRIRNRRRRNAGSLPRWHGWLLGVKEKLQGMWGGDAGEVVFRSGRKDFYREG